MKHLSKQDVEIINCLINEGRPMTTPEIIDKIASDKSFSGVKHRVTKLQSEGYLVIDSIQKRNSYYYRTYTPDLIPIIQSGVNKDIIPELFLDYLLHYLMKVELDDSRKKVLKEINEELKKWIK